MVLYFSRSLALPRSIHVPLFLSLCMSLPLSLCMSPCRAASPPMPRSLCLPASSSFSLSCASKCFLFQRGDHWGESRPRARQTTVTSRAHRPTSFVEQRWPKTRRHRSDDRPKQHPHLVTQHVSPRWVSPRPSTFLFFGGGQSPNPITCLFLPEWVSPTLITYFYFAGVGITNTYHLFL